MLRMSVPGEFEIEGKKRDTIRFIFTGGVDVTNLATTTFVGISTLQSCSFTGCVDALYERPCLQTLQREIP